MQSINQYPDWILEDTPTRQDEVDEVEELIVVGEKGKTRTNDQETVKEKKKRPVVIPYVRGLYITRDFKSYEVPMYFKPVNTLR